uniref:Major tail protein n=1 Tax=Salmonella phage vB_SEnST11_KE22 TaxID=3161173 RepID=A0AAU8GEL2_9CAUD
MKELLLVNNPKDPFKYSEWFNLDFTNYPVGTTTGFYSNGLTFNRSGVATCSVVLEDGIPAISFNGDGAISANTTPDKLLNNDWRITLIAKIKASTTNPMIFVGRSYQSNGSGTWIASLTSTAAMDFWWNASRGTSTGTIARDKWYRIIFESVGNKLTVYLNTELDDPTPGIAVPGLSGKVIPDLADGTNFPLVIGGSADSTTYHGRYFLRSLKIETKRRL